jgi:hypothetical protein
MSNGEYYGGSVSGSSCSYATLGNYYNYADSNGDPVHKVGALGYQIVPTQQSMTPGWGGIGYYDVLTHGGQSCSGYANIMTAYGPNADNCGVSYQKRPCGS